MTAIGRWSCGTSWPYCDGDLVRAGGVLRSELPAPGPELDPGQAPHARALRGSSRSSHSAYSPSSSARARPLVEAGARVFTIARVASCTSRSPPSELGRCWVSAARSLACRPVAGEPVEDRLHGAGARPEPRVVQPLGELERRSGVVEPASKRVAQARRQWMADWSAGEVASLSASWRSSRDPVDAQLGKEDERLGAPRADLGVRQQVGRHGPGTGPLTGDVVGASRSERPAAARLGVIGRGQPEGMLDELGRGCDRAVLEGQARRLVEHGRDVGIGPVRRQGQVTGADQGVVGQSGDRGVHSPPAVAEVAVQDGRQEWMREPDRPVDRSITCASTAGWMARASMPARSSSDSGSVPSAAANASASRVGPGRPAILAPSRSSRVFGTGKRVQRAEVRAQGPGQLDREERVPARLLPDAERGLPGEAGAEPIAQQPMQCADAERPDRHPPDPAGGSASSSLDGGDPSAEPPGEQHQDVACREPAQREGERGRRGRVEPLDVIDGDHDGLVASPSCWSTSRTASATAR